MEKISKQYDQEFFNGVSFSGKTFSYHVFEECTFENCDLSSSLYENCKFNECSFTNCNCSNFQAPHSVFSGVTFDGCKIIGVDWTKSFWDELQLAIPLKFHRCNLSDSSFFGLKLSEAVLENCRLSYTDFRDGEFRKVNFSGSDFSNAFFGNTDLTGADFTDASNYSINIHNNKIKGARFDRYNAINLLKSLDIELV